MQWLPALSADYQRSLVETKMHCFKRVGERVVARSFERQVVELDIRVALWNRFSQLGRLQSVAVATVAWVRLGPGSCRAESICATKSQ